MLRAARGHHGHQNIREEHYDLVGVQRYKAMGLVGIPLEPMEQGKKCNADW